VVEWGAAVLGWEEIQVSRREKEKTETRPSRNRVKRKHKTSSGISQIQKIGRRSLPL